MLMMVAVGDTLPVVEVVAWVRASASMAATVARRPAGALSSERVLVPLLWFAVVVTVVGSCPSVSCSLHSAGRRSWWWWWLWLPLLPPLSLSSAEEKAPMSCSVVVVAERESGPSLQRLRPPGTPPWL